MGRVLMSYIASMYVRLVTGMKIMDTTAGFKCYRREVLRNINPGHIRLVGYGFQIEMKFTAWQLGYNIVELPIIFTDRRAGTSKMSGSIFGEAMWGVLRMKLASIFRKPRRIET
jgi:dolichol-phosphate mannosyltransferase